ncbi:Rne/Rng family ribonuclease [Trichocoleus sp. FACHB-262]|uniref:Rne/Rng family ribonuclease n=1 Tax=Trichocoleus sp. FACHB-262 TaxID=2692869 RepID=UPI001684C87E|nr:Rne/Rng family ribonuclease [Trichocoleus sp. FACHB-262]MBD2123498.1 Rne/Rng family ribonuclease [Trichocoleus sp. FACHB-262]
MSKQIIIAEQHRIAAVFSEDQIQELIVATGSHQISDVYLGVVENVLPGIDAAFVNIGDSERNGFIHVTDLGPLRLRRSAASITELLAPQQKVLVQVMKEPTGNKGPRLTGNITLPGRYLVLMPYGKGVNLSRRIRNENERNRLRALAILIKPAGMGLLVRTEAEGMAEEAILEDLEALQKQWESILQEASSTRAPALLNRDDDFIQRVLRDTYSGEVNRIVVDSHTGLKRVKQHLINWSGGRSPQGVLIDQHRDRISVLEYFRVNAAIREALKPRVDLPSGGYIIIEPTEALTVIDVNSGSFTRSATARETVLWTNCEAATEIARQLRLRNLAGVIIVDFIDMDTRRDQMQVLEHFNKALKSDKARPQIAQLSELGLVELTRKRQGQNIYELFGRTCQTCGGLGHTVHLPGEVPQYDADVAERSGTFGMRESAAPSTEPRVRIREPINREPINREPISREPINREPLNPEPATFSPWEGRSDDLEFDSGSDPLEPDLMNHPNYQERGGPGNNRRRRRRRIGITLGEGEVAPKGPINPREIIPAKTIAVKAEFIAEAETVSPLEDFPVIVPKEAESERPERVKTTKREFIKPVVEPPEVVTVEMTPEEQDVFALMGISPLVLANREVKDPKSTIIQVTLPGEAPPVPSALVTPTENGATSSSAVEFASPRSAEVPRVAPPVRNTPATVETAPPTVSPVSEDVVAPLQSETNEAEVTPVTTEAEEDNLGPARRRRRRSSAADASNKAES